MMNTMTVEMKTMTKFITFYRASSAEPGQYFLFSGLFLENNPFILPKTSSVWFEKAEFKFTASYQKPEEFKEWTNFPSDFSKITLDKGTKIKVRADESTGFGPKVHMQMAWQESLFPSVKEIVLDYLNKKKFEGLYSPTLECGCGIGKLMHCDCNPFDCIPGHKVPCDCFTEETEEKCEFHIMPGRRK